MKMIEGKNMKGYLWYSNRSNPIVYNGQELKLSLDDESNPFVIEGQLYDGDTNTSYSIKYVDGEYLVKEYVVKGKLYDRKDVTLHNVKNEDWKCIVETCSNVEKKEEIYKCKVIDKYLQSHRMDGKVLHFTEVWRPVPDSLCEGMQVLHPTGLIFIGFKEEE